MEQTGKFVVWQFGILVRREFNTREEAEQWAEKNYRIRENWRVERA